MTGLRGGVRMTPLKARLFDAIKAAGDVGISTNELLFKVYEGERLPQRSVIKSHIWQINEILEDTGLKIVSLWETRRVRYWMLVTARPATPPG